MGRDKVFDSLKFVLICLVVIGHVIERNLYTDHNTSVVFSFIYTFHMPLFIFISGYFTKNINWQKYKKSFVSILVTYFVFQGFFSIGSILGGTFTWFDYFTNPLSVLWYIIGLLFWRFWFCIIPKAFIKLPLMLSVSLIIAFSIHYVNDQNYFFTRIITFYPYFILGYFCPSNLITKIRNANRFISASFLVLLFVGLYFFVNHTFIFVLFGGIPYSNHSSLFTGLALTAFCYILTAITSICVINLVTEKFYKLGSTTLDIYLIHPFYVYTIYQALILKYNNWNPDLIVDILVGVVIVVICVFVSKLSITKYFTDPVNAFKALAMQKTVKSAVRK